jgi:hypothetical protein
MMHRHQKMLASRDSHVIVGSTSFLRIYPKSPRNTNTFAGKFDIVRILVTLESLRKPAGEPSEPEGSHPLVLGLTHVDSISFLASSYFARLPVYLPRKNRGDLGRSRRGEEPILF